MALRMAKGWLDKRMAKAEPEVVASLKKFAADRYMTIVNFTQYNVRYPQYRAIVESSQYGKFWLSYSRRRKEWRVV